MEVFEASQEDLKECVRVNASLDLQRMMRE